MRLSFRKLQDGEMDRPPTQRDQFNNDDVELVDALVRESLQNSLDARVDGETVRVRFALHRPNQEESQALKGFLDLEKLKAHLEASLLMPEAVDFEQPQLLVVEDFGTTGLTGSWDSMDTGAFADFWRRMGKSHKSGRSLGRWGLGKLVFSSSSQARIFLGLTMRKSESELGLLLGQAVLTTHEIGGERFDSHGFFCEPGPTGMQLPVTDQTVVRQFKETCSLTRTNESGLSIVVPYVLDTVTEERIVRAVLRNYFFPIQLGRLVVTVGTKVIDADNFATLAKEHGGTRFANGELAEFIASMRAARNGEITPLVLPANWMSVGVATVLSEHVESLRQRYQSGECLHLQAPLLLKRKDGSELPSIVGLFLQKASDEGDTLFVRDTIVLPAEAKYFRGRHVLAALVADDKAVCAFLGDAENPAHTSWSANAEKVVAEWRSPANRLKEIRGALQQVYDAIVSTLEMHDPNAAINFFSAEAEHGSSGVKPKGPVVRPPNPNPPPPVEKAYRLSRLNGGFAIKGASSMPAEQLPLVIRVRAAYDVLRGNPFSKHDPLDFDFSKNDLKIAATGASFAVQGANALLVKANTSDFEFSVSGFDTRRDLIIDAARQ